MAAIFFLTNPQVIHRFADMLHGTWIWMPKLLLNYSQKEHDVPPY